MDNLKEMFQVYKDDWEKVNESYVVTQIPEERDLVKLHKISATISLTIHNYMFLSKLFYNKKILDLGCGSGFGTEILRRKENKVIGIDKDEEIIKIARKNFPKSMFIVNDFTQNLSSLGLVDVIICFVGFQGFDNLKNPGDLRNLFCSFKSILNNGGQFITYNVVSTEMPFIKELVKDTFDRVDIFLQYRLGLFLTEYVHLSNEFKYEIIIGHKK